MNAKIISAKDLNGFVAGIIDSGTETYGVQEKEVGKFHYAPLKSAANLRLDYDVTIIPPKAIFSPPTEMLLKFETEPKLKVRACHDTNRKIIIGVHPYDMNAINQMDEVWKDKHEDSHYFKRRNNSVIIGVDPESASAWSFWHLVDSKVVCSGFDLWLTKLDKRTYLVEVATKAGAELLDKYAHTKIAGENDINKRSNIRENLYKLCSKERTINAKVGEIPLLVKNNIDHPLWAEKAKKCYSCGSCNIVCPTCYCFDVKDETNLDLKTGKRERLWDGCQLEGFAAVGSGENFREHRVDRYKHRFFRKTVYQYEKYGHLACVGCGRCGSVCLPNIADPVDIINKLKGEK